MIKFILTSALFTSLLFSISSYGETAKQEKKEEIKPVAPVLQQSEKPVEKKAEPQEETKTISLNGKYVNSQNSVLTISNADNLGFTFSYNLKGACDGIEEEGFAAFSDKLNAYNYSEDGSELEHFTVNGDGSVEFEIGLPTDYIGMECAKFFDTHFTKK
jgi:hypothetical protein